MAIIEDQITNFKGGVNTEADARLLEQSVLSDAINFLPSKLGGMEKGKVWHKDLLFIRESVVSIDEDTITYDTDDILDRPAANIGTGEELTETVEIDSPIDTIHHNSLPLFERERVLYLANNTFDTEFSKNVPYTINTATGYIDEDYHDYTSLDDIAEELRIGIRIDDAIVVTPSEPLTFSIAARRIGNPNPLSAVLYYLDGTPIQQFNVSEQDNVITEWTEDTKAVERVHFTIEVEDQVVLDKGEYYIQLTADNADEFNHYDLALKAQYKTIGEDNKHNLQGWTERKINPDVNYIIEDEEVPFTDAQKLSSTTIETEFDPELVEIGMTESYLQGVFSARQWMSRSNGQGWITLDVDFSNLSIIYVFDEFVDGLNYSQYDMMRYKNSHHRLNASTNVRSFTGVDATLFQPNPQYIKPDTVTAGRSLNQDNLTIWTSNRTVASLVGTTTKNNVVKGIGIEGIRWSGYDANDNIAMVRVPVRRRIGINPDTYGPTYWIRVRLNLSSTSYQSATYFRDNGSTASYSGLTIETRKRNVLFGTNRVELTIGNLPTSEWQFIPDSNLTMHFIYGGFEEGLFGSYNPVGQNYWSTANPFGVPAAEFIDHEEEGKVVRNHKVRIQWGTGTTISSISKTYHNMWYRSNLEVQHFHPAEVMLAQRSANNERYATSMISAKQAYSGANEQGVSAGLDTLNNHDKYYFTDGNSLFAIAGRRPPSGEVQRSRASSLHLNTLLYDRYEADASIKLYSPKFIAQIKDMAVYNNYLILAGVGGIAILSPNSIDEQGEYKPSEVVVPTLPSRIESKAESIQALVPELWYYSDVFPPSITSLVVHGINPGRVFAAQGQMLFWSGGSGEYGADDITQWNGLAVVEFGDGADEILKLASFNDQLLIFTAKGDLYVLSGEVPSDPALSFNTLQANLVAHVGVIDKLEVTTNGLCIFSTKDGNAWYMSGSLAPKRFDIAIGSQLNIESIKWEPREQRVWLNCGKTTKQSYYDGEQLVEITNDPLSYVWDSKTDSWWKVRNNIDSDPRSFRSGKNSWIVGVTYSEEGDGYGPIEVYEPKVIQETQQFDEIIINGDNRDSIVQPQNSVYHNTTSEAFFITKEYDMNVWNTKQVREIRSFGQLYRNSIVAVYVITNEGDEIDLGNVNGLSDFVNLQDKLVRRQVGAFRPIQSFRIKYVISSPYKDSFRTLFTKTIVNGKVEKKDD